LLVQLLLAVPTLLPVQAPVHADSIQPGGDFGLAAEGLHLLMGGDEGLLGEVLSVGHRSGHAIAKGVDHSLVLSDKVFIYSYIHSGRFVFCNGHPFPY
jgi:hypothetical protein